MISLNKAKTSVSLFTANEKEAEDFLGLITLLRPNNRKKNTYTFLVKSDDGLNEKKLSFERQEVDLKKNYNDDLPWNEMMKFVGSEKEGLAILYGPAGTGKTTLIKHLIQENPEKNFILINSKDLENPDSEYYLEYFLENDNRIFILEDCEKLLLTRNQGGGSNQLITILNMTDGLLGSTLKTKFICTFNTDLRNIDTALLRKGRMKVKYYVGPLCVEKCRELMNDKTIQKEMTLAEIYNREENDFSKETKKRIGF
jgi:SpoVK/Ycf46/Vps4 family AAA+-type ATPase